MLNISDPSAFHPEIIIAKLLSRLTLAASNPRNFPLSEWVYAAYALFGASCALKKEISVKKSLRNLVLSSAVLVLSAGSLHAGVTGGAPEPHAGKLAVMISVVLVALGY